MTDKRDQSYPKREADRRFEAALKAGLNTPPKPLDQIKHEQSKKRQRPKSGAASS